MCRYAYHEYRDHFVCFACRKMFRQWMKYRAGQAVACPQCHAAMVDMGKDFKAPRQTDVRQWEKARQLHRHGYDYNSCGCGGRGPTVKTLKEVEPFLEAKARQRAEGEHHNAAQRRWQEKHDKACAKFYRKIDVKQRNKQQSAKA